MAKSEKTRNLQETLAKRLSELTDGFSEDRIQKVLSKTNSLGRLKTLEEYRRDRDLAISSLQQVSYAKEYPVQWEVMKNELDSCMLFECTLQNLPIQLHQFYCNRLAQLAQLKHILQVRWSRFALRHPKIYDKLHIHYQKAIEHILNEYTFCLNQARKLSLAVDLHLADKPYPLNIVGEDDIKIYLRWLTYVYSTSKDLTTFVSKIQLLSLENQGPPEAPKYKPPPTPKWTQSKVKTVRARIKRLSTTTSPNISLTSLTKNIPSSSQQQQSSLPLSASDKIEDVPVLSLPLIKTDDSSVKSYLEQLMSTYELHVVTNDFKSVSDILKVFHLVLGHFRSTFKQQTDTLKFQTYDIAPSQDIYNREKGSAKIRFLKKANWLDYIAFRSAPDTLQVISYTKVRDSIQGIDPLLYICNQCTYLDSEEKVLYALSQHHESVLHPQTVKPTPLSVNKSGNDTLLLWKCIYTAVDMRNPMNFEELTAKFTLDDQEKSKLSDKRGSLEMDEALQLLDQDEGRRISTNAEKLPRRDLLFSYILLRHLRIRDIRYKCLTYINYFCSIERTLTLNSTSFPMEPDSLQFNMGISSHLFKTPVDYILKESEFMQYHKIENRDDYYSFENASDIFVWDEAGKPVMYDVAEIRLRELEEQLLMIATYYIQKNVLNSQESTTINGEIDIERFSLPNVDRFTILLDLWICQSQLLEEKMKTINLYLEAYHSCYEKQEKEKIAKIITNIMKLEIRLDTDDKYFTHSFQQETECMRAHYDAVQPILHHLLEAERTYNRTHSGLGLQYYGLPPLLTEHIPINLSGYIENDINHYLLECCNSLSYISLLTGIVQKSLQIYIGLYAIEGVSHVVSLHTQIWKKIQHSWISFKPLGIDYNKDIQQRFFSLTVMDSPHCVIDLLEFHLKQTLAKHENSPLKEIQEKKLQVYCDIVQLITSRYWLMVTCEQTALLYNIYRKQSTQLEQEDSHLFLRFIPLSSSQTNANKTLDELVQEARDPKNDAFDGSKHENILPAIQELDDQHIGRFSFQTKEDIMKILISSSGLQNLMITLQTQVATRSALLIACQQSAAIIRFSGPLVKERKFTNFSQLASAASKNAEHIQLIYLLSGSFISFQKEKTAVRDYMLCQASSLSSSKGEELEKRKCHLIETYNNNLLVTFSSYSLRHQLSVIYLKLNKLLEDYPHTRDAFFTIGGIVIPSPTHTNGQNKLTRGRVKAVLSQDGKRLLNIFYIPHVSEILTIYQKLPVTEQRDILTIQLQLASLLLDILMYFSATTKLGQMCDNIGTVSSGKEIGGDIHQLQTQLSQLKNPSDPNEVLTYLKLHYSCIVLSHNVIVRHYLKRNILSYGNEKMIKVVTNTCIPALDKLLDTNSPHLISHPLLSSSPPLLNSSELSPFKQFWSKYGIGLIGVSELTDVYSHIYISIAPLDSIGRQAASGELLAMSLLLEDILYTSGSLKRPSSTISRLSKASHTLKGSSTWGGSGGMRLSVAPVVPPLSSLPPLTAEKIVLKFLMVTTQLEQLRDAWSCSLIGVNEISSQNHVIHLEKQYHDHVMTVAKRHVAKQEVKSIIKLQVETESTEGTASTSLATLFTETDISWESLEQSESLNELLLRETQLARLIDLLHQQFLHDEIRHVNSLIHLSLQEQQRDDETLPIDLWKRNSMKDIPGIPQSHIVENFLHSLQQNNNDTSVAKFETSQSHFDQCISQLRNDVLAREKECYLLYASFFESMIQSLYHQLHLKNQEIESYKYLVQSISTQSMAETMITTARYTHNLLLEITALKMKIAQMKTKLEKKEKELRDEIHLEYQTLSNELQASSLTIKDKYEQYRQTLYNEMVTNVYKTRQNVANSIASLHDKLNKGLTDEAAIDDIKGKNIQNIQEENVRLTNTLTKLQSIHQWKKRQADNKLIEQDLLLRKEMDEIKCQYIDVLQKKKKKIVLLKQQVSVLQKRVANGELETEMLKKSLEHEKKKIAAYKEPKTTKSDSISKYEKMQEAKIQELGHELEEKELQLSLLQNQHETEKNIIESDRIKTAKVIQQTKQQLSQERQLKLEAFHQVESLINEVHSLENQCLSTKTPSLYSGSLFTMVKQSVVPSVSPSTLYANTPASASVQSIKLQRPKSLQGRLRPFTPDETFVTKSEELGAALKIV